MTRDQLAYASLQEAVTKGSEIRNNSTAFMILMVEEYPVSLWEIAKGNVSFQTQDILPCAKKKYEQ